jgi:hypothetical protein
MTRLPAVRPAQTRACIRLLHGKTMIINYITLPAGVEKEPIVLPGTNSTIKISQKTEGRKYFFIFLSPLMPPQQQQ